MEYTPEKGFYKWNVADEKRVSIEETANTVQKIEDEFLSHASQLANTAKDIESRGINATQPPTPYLGAKGDGTDESALINTLLQNFDYVYLPSNKTFSISNTIIVPNNKGLITLGLPTTIQLLVKDIPAVEVGVDSKFTGAKVLLASGNTSDLGCGIKIRLDPLSAKPFIDRVEVIGTDLTGNGIYIEGNSGYAAFGQINNMYFTKVKTAFKANVSAPAWANGFIGSNWVIRSSVRAFHLTGVCEGNNFTNVQWNTGSASIEPIYCESNFNEFHGFWWDLGVSTVPSQIATFAGTAQGNIIKSPDTISSWTVNDLTDTKLNFVNTMKDDVYDVIKQSSYLPNVFLSATEYKKWGYWFDRKPYGGVQDNFLAYADKMNVTTNTGKTLVSGGLSYAFDPFAGLSTNKPLWNLQTSEQAQITIDVSKPAYTSKRLDYLQVVFSSTLEARYVKMESSTDGTTWTKLKEISDNDKRYVVFHDNLTATTAGTGFTKLRITISDPINASKDVKVEAIIGRLLNSPGYTFLPLGGNAPMVGDLDMNSNAVKNTKFTQLAGTTSAIAPNNSIFLESNVLKFKDSVGVVKIVNLT